MNFQFPFFSLFVRFGPTVASNYFRPPELDLDGQKLLRPGFRRERLEVRSDNKKNTQAL